MLLGDLTYEQLTSRLRASGLRLQTGPFVFRISSPLAKVARNLHLLYDAFPLAEPECFADFHVRIRTSSGLRRVLRPQSIFDLDGIEPFKPLPGKQAFALLEWGMNWCIYSHAHQFLMIHGAVLEKHGRAILLPAPSGSGKSTLCAALMCRGWRLLSDELVLIDPDTAEIHPLCRPVSLKNRSIDVMRDFAPDAVITTPIPDTSKGTVAHMRPSAASFAGVKDCVLPWRVIFPRYRENSPTLISPLSRADTFMRLVENAFNYTLLGPLGFQALARVIDRVQGLEAEYSALDDIIARLDALVDEDTSELA